MISQNNLDLQGNFLTHPFAELLAEISQGRLTGSLRVTANDLKRIVYFKGGKVAFAVSNAHASRLSELLLRTKKIDAATLAKLPKFTNDLELASILTEKAIFLRSETDQFILEQIEGILVDILSWPEGDWFFSPLARLKDGLKFNVGTELILLDYGRCITDDELLKRFRNLQESFSRNGSDDEGPQLNLNGNEQLVLSRFTEEPKTAQELISMNSMPEITTLQTIYALWLSGLLTRTDWNPAFSDLKIAAIRNAHLELRKEAMEIGGLKKLSDDGQRPLDQVVVATKNQAPPVKEISLEDYLARVENAETYYDLLDVDPAADIAELKQAYFALAKMFHPDRFHSFGGEKFRRIQTAFTELAQAHETLKSPESREVYDYKMRKELTGREKSHEKINVGERNIQIEQAAEYFESGFSLFMEEKFDTATPFLAKAAYLAPKNAKYRAYYGKALSVDGNQRHKAEAELQAALKIDPYNATFRILLAEFFMQHNLLKRAEGELRRLLAVFPANREASEMLESLKK